MVAVMDSVLSEGNYMMDFAGNGVFPMISSCGRNSSSIFAFQMVIELVVMLIMSLLQ
jgi:hypothetical protein